MEGYRIENCVTLIVTGAMTIGLYWLGAGNHSFWSMVLLLNIGYEERAK